MKALFAVLVTLFASATIQAADFKVSSECRKTIQNDLKKRSLRLTRIVEATYYPGGNDGASSWESEYILNAYARDGKNKSVLVLVYINDNYSCRVLSVSKIR